MALMSGNIQIASRLHIKLSAVVVFDSGGSQNIADAHGR